MSKLVIGSLETCHLPDLNIFDLQIRIDTGAKTSSLHVDEIKKDTISLSKLNLDNINGGLDDEQCEYIKYHHKNVFRDVVSK